MDAIRRLRNDVQFSCFLLLVAVEEMVMSESTYKIPQTVAVALSTSRIEFMKMAEKDDPAHRDLYRLLADFIDDRLAIQRKLADFEAKLTSSLGQVKSCTVALEELYDVVSGRNRAVSGRNRKL